MVKGIYILNHPTDGMVGTLIGSIGTTQRNARKAVQELYPAEKMFDVWTTTAWWLMKNDGMPFFYPKPWPYAIIYLHEKMVEVMGEVPKWLTLFVGDGSQGFMHMKAPSSEDAIESVMRYIKPYGGTHKETKGGYTYHWLSPEGADIVVGYSIRLHLE